MLKQRTNQEWQTLIAQSESSSMSKLAFCKLHGLNPSTFYAKRQQLKTTLPPQGFVKAEVVEKTASLQVTHIPAASMTLRVNKIELSIPQSTPVAYLAELIGALS
ncbi:IS66 family insertion sequence element accessory protein TnpA [Providencia stuartii]|uniref:IS66 family insertion sequence element accessory protein TnpA n=1 Tax=Providencia stuartii TaxID=588 RepID=UPI002989A1C0|nr:IS66 family insertion sequence element accessory protein TnpB [Providencia stuartii]